MRAKSGPGHPHTQFAHLHAVGDLLIGGLIQPRRPSGFGPLDEVILIAQPLAPAKVRLASLVLATDIVHPASLEAGHHKIGTIATIAEDHLARRQTARHLP